MSNERRSTDFQRKASSGRGWRRGWTGALLLALAACANETPPASHQYLVPVASLPSGERVPPIAAVERLAVRHTEGRVGSPLSKASAPLAPWLVTPEPERPGTRGGVLSTVAAPLTLSLPVSPDVPDFTAVELDLEFAGGTTARVTLEWRDGTRRVFEEWIPIRNGRAPLVVFLGEIQRRADLARITIEPATDPARQFEVHAIALVERGTPPVVASAPSSGMLETSAATGAQGWLLFDGLRRLVWPQLAGAPLEARFTLEHDQRLILRAWPGAQPADNVRARVFDEATGKLIKELQGEWTPAGLSLSTTLAARPGKPYRLELTGGDPARPNQLGAYWEAPRLEQANNSERPAPARPNIVLITMDTTRADFVAEAAIAPNFHALSDLVFTNAYSVSNTTTPSHASILTGQLPHEHGAIAVGKYVLPESATTLAEVLRESGYRTAAFTNVEHIDAAHGFAQGFDLFFEGGELGSFDGLLATLSARSVITEERAPFFIWLHLFDPHTPYIRADELKPAMARFFAKEAHALAGPLPGLALGTELPDLGATSNALPDWAREQVHLESFARDEDLDDLARRYAGGVHYADALIGLMAEALRAVGELDDTLIAITADHGESLGEAGVWANHGGLFPKNLHVPLGIHLPKALSDLALTPTQLAAPVSNHDLFPTLLELLRMTKPAPSAHTLLAPDPNRILWFESDRLSQAARLEDELLVITTLRTTRLYNNAERSALEVGHHQAFDLANDPRGERDIFDPAIALHKDWAETAAKHALMSANPADLERALSPEEADRLRALGYLSDDE